MRTTLLFASILGLVLAGCVGSEPTPATEEPSPNLSREIIVDPNRPDPTFAAVQTNYGVAPNWTPTLERAPDLVVGEWWRINYLEPLTGVEVEFVRIVADVADDTFVMGMPHEGWYKEAMVYHAPGFGDVSRQDLSWDTHDDHFQPLRFPLVEGDSWTTRFSGSPLLTASVTQSGGNEATVEFRNPTGDLTLTIVYDAVMREIREFVHANLVYEITEHGYGFEGWVTVPRSEDLIFFHGRVAQAVDVTFSPNPVPFETIEIAGGYNRVTFFQMTTSLGVEGAGLFRVVTRAPDGTEFVTESLPGDRAKMDFFEHNAPDGTWEVEFVALGPGYAFLEGIAYHQYDVHVPSGRIRSDHAHPVIR